jgi:hypothetical protein
MSREYANGTRAAAVSIDAALRRHVPVLTLAEAARRAGITPAGWRKVIRTGRGRTATLMAMARVTGAEPEVRRALGLPPPPPPQDTAPPQELSLDERVAILWDAYLAERCTTVSGDRRAG